MLVVEETLLVFIDEEIYCSTVECTYYDDDCLDYVLKAAKRVFDINQKTRQPNKDGWTYQCLVQVFEQDNPHSLNRNIIETHWAEW